jgi:hypothetical protein
MFKHLAHALESFDPLDSDDHRAYCATQKNLQAAFETFELLTALQTAIDREDVSQIETLTAQLDEQPGLESVAINSASIAIRAGDHIQKFGLGNSIEIFGRELGTGFKELFNLIFRWKKMSQVQYRKLRIYSDMMRTNRELDPEKIATRTGKLLPYDVLLHDLEARPLIFKTVQDILSLPKPTDKDSYDAWVTKFYHIGKPLEVVTGITIDEKGTMRETDKRFGAQQNATLQHLGYDHVEKFFKLYNLVKNAQEDWKIWGSYEKRAPYYQFTKDETYAKRASGHINDALYHYGWWYVTVEIRYAERAFNLMVACSRKKK